jgi:hypothetical protein
MRLYAGMSPDFIRDSTHNQIAEKLKIAFRAQFRHDPPPSEIRSWRESLRAMAQVFTEAELTDHGVILEYQLPLTSKRLDCMITARNCDNRDSAVVVELKQWDRSSATGGEGLVRACVGGGERDVLHPSVQANQYRRYLADMHEAFYEAEPVRLAACAYLHNYFPAASDAIYAAKFDDVRSVTPLFDADSVADLVRFLGNRLEGGNGLPVLERVERSRFRPSKRLLDHVAGVIKREPRFVLLDEQQVVFSRILASVREGLTRRRKHIFLINGGPGTGKSVLAINLMSELSGEGFNAQYATGSRAFTETLKKVVGRRAGQQFRYFNQYMAAEPSSIDALICDESHRIRSSSNHRFTRENKKSTKPQLQEIIDASRTSVFFIDDRQVVRPGEVGSSDLIREYAMTNDCVIEEHRLEAQFRCGGSAGFVNWIDNTLSVEETATPIWDQRNESFELQIVASPDELDRRIRAHNADGHNARLVAGFCWPWSKELAADGSLIDDVVVGDFKRPWNARSEARGLKPGIPPEVLWAYDPRGIDQVGCIYTAQGFEFDYVGVIWGPDLAYDLDRGCWQGHKQSSHDSVVKRSGDRFVDLVKNTYRVLLSRGLKGCYIYFMDKDTERFVRSRTEGLGVKPKLVAAPIVREAPPAESLPFRRLPLSEVQPYVNAVPLVDLKFAAGVFSNVQAIDQDEVEWVELPAYFRPQPGIFVAQVVGESMNRRIPNGSWCLFKLSPTGTRQRRVVVVQHPDIGDPDLGGSFTVKLYTSEKVAAEDGEWTHKRITLQPDSDDSTFCELTFEASSAENLRVVAEMITVLTLES